MNENNLDYLKNSLKYLGFGEKLNKVLESAIRQELPAFKLQLGTAYNPPNVPRNELPAKDHMTYEVSFSKSKESDMYFLNSYQAKLHSASAPAKEQQVNLSSGNWITAKEAYHLLSGRAINKDILPREEGAEKVNVWMKLDLDVKDARGNYPVKTFYPQYGFDLNQALTKYPLKQSDEKQIGDTLQALKKGELVPVELKVNGKFQQAFAAANPEMKAMDFFNKKLEPIRNSQIFPQQAAGVPAEKESKVLIVNEKAANDLKKNERPWEGNKEDTTSNRTVSR